MKLLVFIFLLFSINPLFSQKQRLVAVGASKGLFISHKVSSTESFASIAATYNLSPVALANYNNIDFYEGRLLAKYLKVPLNSQNFYQKGKVPQAESLVPVYQTLQKKQSLQNLSSRYGIPVLALSHWNATRSMSPGKPVVIGFLKAKRNKLYAFEKPFPAEYVEVPADVAKTDTAQQQQPDSTSIASIEEVAKPVVADTIKKEEIKPAATTSTIKKKTRPVTQRRFFPERFLKELLAVAISLLILTLVLITLIYFYLSLKKRRFKMRERLKSHVEKLITTAIVNEEDENRFIKESFEMSRILEKDFHKKNVRQIVIDEIVNAKRSFRGKAGANLVRLYEQLNLNEDSATKLTSSMWHIKAKGIQELAIMDQSKFLLKIYRQTNSENEYVRMEAQSSVVHFGGFKGLRFLDVLSYPISDWQQIKLIEQLSIIPTQQLPDYNKWLSSSNDSVILFTLKIIMVFHQLALHNSVAKCLSHANAAIRLQAIKCLGEINNEETPEILENAYVHETHKNKLEILNVLKKVGGQSQLYFLEQQLHSKEDDIKLAAAQALKKCCVDGLVILRELSGENTYPYTHIFNHVNAKANA